MMMTRAEMIDDLIMCDAHGYDLYELEHMSDYSLRLAYAAYEDQFED